MFDAAEVVHRLQTVPHRADAATYRDLLLDCRRLKSFADARAAELSQLAATAGGSDVSDEIQRATGCSGRDAKRKATTATELPSMPQTRHSLDSGAITGNHADALAALRARLDHDQRLALNTDEADLVTAAKEQTIDAFYKTLRAWAQAHSGDDGIAHADKLRAKRRLSLSKNHDGMGTVRAELDPEAHEILSRAIGDIANELFHGTKIDQPPNTHTNNPQLMADALTELARRAVGASAADGRRARPTIIATIDHQTLIDQLEDVGVSARLADGTPIPAETARRLACDADILPIVLGANSQPLNVGRTRRLATTAQRHALRTQYGTCAINWCDKPFHWCHIHHHKPWETGGNTNLDNLIPLCPKHHHLVHEGGWHTQQRPDGTHQFIHQPPPHHKPTPPNRAPPTAPPHNHATPTHHQQPMLV